MAWLVVVQLVVEGGQRSIGSTLVGREVPCEVERSVQSANERLALAGNGLGVGVLVAHHNENLAVDAKFVVKGVVAVLNLTNCVRDAVEVDGVLVDELLHLVVSRLHILKGIGVF